MRPIDLRVARKRKRLTQTALADKIGRPQSLISKLENGVFTDPSFETVKELARALDVDPMALRFGPPDRNTDRVAS